MAHVNIELSTSESESELDNLGKSSSERSRFIYDDEDDDEAKSNRKSPPMASMSRRPTEARGRMSAMAFHPQKSSSESSDSGSDNGSKSQTKTNQSIDGIYNPANFNDLNVSTEIKDLFQHIMRYIPQRIDLEYKLKPFIPEFIPAVGDTDAFLKVVTPQKTWSGEPFDASQLLQLGLEVLDEPSAAQSDSALLFLQLRATEKTSKKSSSHLVTIKKVLDVEKNTKAIDQWINDISDLHGSHPPPTVIYKNTMPDVDSLLQDWPQEEANALKDGFPNYQLNCSLEQYVELVCSIFDIPVFESRIESLHMLFSMCLAIKNYYTYITTAEALEVESKKLNPPDADSDNEQVIMQ